MWKEGGDQGRQGERERVGRLYVWCMDSDITVGFCYCGSNIHVVVIIIIPSTLPSGTTIKLPLTGLHKHDLEINIIIH